MITLRIHVYLICSFIITTRGKKIIIFVPEHGSIEDDKQFVGNQLEC